MEDETLWLTQAQMCELYQTSKSNVSEHIKHIFEEGELDEESVVRKFRTTATDGKSYMTTFYNLAIREGVAKSFIMLEEHIYGTLRQESSVVCLRQQQSATVG